MKKLAEKEYWDSIYKQIKPNDSEFKENFLKKWFKNQTRDYSNYLMWENILPKYLPRGENLKVVEVGCAPGKYLIKFKKQFGFEPFGVEYSKDGVKIAKENFLKNNINPENIIEADFFDTKFQEKYREKFDLVFSRGFIEHYDDVKSVVAKHLNLAKSGGFIIVSIPNLSGINNLLARFFNVDSYRLHNTSIMKKDVFADLFDTKKIEKIYCDYVGIFSFGLFNTNNKIKYYLYRLLLLIQRPFDLLFRVFFKNNLLKNSFSSPYLLFIGKKIEL